MGYCLSYVQQINISRFESINVYFEQFDTKNSKYFTRIIIPPTNSVSKPEINDSFVEITLTSKKNVYSETQLQ